MDDDGGKSLRELYLLFAQLKEEPRAGWRLRGVRDGGGWLESVADHSWMVAMIVLAADLPPLSKLRALEIALVHDLAEIVTGDLTPADNVPEEVKNAAEDLAMRFFTALAAATTAEGAAWIQGSSTSSSSQRQSSPAPPASTAATVRKMTEMFASRLAEFNARSTREARIVNAADTIEAAVQAQRYMMLDRTKRKTLGDFRDDLERYGEDYGCPIDDTNLGLLGKAIVEHWGVEEWPCRFVLLIGGPGSGKGTLCEHLRKHLQSEQHSSTNGAENRNRVKSISLGEQLRQEVQDPKSPFRDFIAESFSRGVAVPAALAMRIFRKRLADDIGAAGEDQDDAVGEDDRKEEMTTIILDGFPRSVKQLRAFETEISDQYTTIYLDCPPDVLAKGLRLRSLLSPGRVDDEDETARLKRAHDYQDDVLAILPLLEKRRFFKVDATQSPEVVASEVGKFLSN